MLSATGANVACLGRHGAGSSRRPLNNMKKSLWISKTNVTLFVSFLIVILLVRNIYISITLVIGEIELTSSIASIKTRTKVDRNDHLQSVCVSPKRYAPWILDGSCMKRPHLSTFSSSGHRRTCGMCGDGAAYLRDLRDKIAVKYEKRCKDMVVYGAALGKKYEIWMRSPTFLGDRSSMVVKRHGTCFFQFITDTNSKGDFNSADGSQNLIVIDPSKMPYDNNH
jgi:hypothetical protein